MATLILRPREATELAERLAKHPAARYVRSDFIERLSAGEPVVLGGPLLSEAMRFLDGATVDLDHTDGGMHHAPGVIYCPHGAVMGTMEEGGRLGPIPPITR